MILSASGNPQSGGINVPDYCAEEQLIESNVLRSEDLKEDQDVDSHPSDEEKGRSLQAIDGF